VQISTNLKSELWFFHSGLGIFSGLTTNQKVLLLLLLLLLVVVVVVVVLESGQSACAEGKEEIRQHIR
jgi:flagellar biosynthesis/type III secretory pathway M-ring protein FliF/YscJ